MASGVYVIAPCKFAVAYTDAGKTRRSMATFIRIDNADPAICHIMVGDTALAPKWIALAAITFLA